MPMRPSARLEKLLARLSRDKWLKPDDAREISNRYARRICGSHGKVVESVPLEAFGVGMIRGRPVAYAWDRPVYLKVLAIVRKKRMSDEAKMIEFLKIAGEIT